MNWIVFVIVGVVVVAGIEYLSRGFRSPWREITLGAVVVVLFIWLLSIAGVVQTPF